MGFMNATEGVREDKRRLYMLHLRGKKVDTY